MGEIRKLEKTIDMDAFFRWLLRKWKSGFLVILIAIVIGGGLGVFRPWERDLSEEELDEIEEYFRYDVNIEETLNIIGLLKKDIEETLETVSDTKAISERMLELSDKMDQLQVYQSFYSSIVEAQDALSEDFNEAQNAYIDKIRMEKGKASGEEVENTSLKENVVRKFKNGIKTGTLLGLITAGVWVFAHIFIFGLNKKIKSIEDVLDICGELSVLEGKRGLIKTDRVQVGNNLEPGKFLSQERLQVIALTEKKTILDVDVCNDKLVESLEKDMAEDVKVVLIVEIGVSRYEDVMKTKERCGDRLGVCLCIR